MHHQRELKVLLLSKKDNEYAERVAAYLREHFTGVIVFTGTRHDKIPDEVKAWKGDLLISFISSWIIPQSLLEQAALAAINFHPGSPEYPGTGCTNFAVYNRETEYGVTCHHMKALVDTGSIISVKRFPLAAEAGVYEITQQCYKLLEEMFYELMEGLLKGEPFPVSTESWQREAYTRKQLNALCEIRPEMSEEEINLRIRATTYKEPWAYTRIGNHTFALKP